MGTDSAIYNIVLLLHIATAIVGFGGLIAHSAYNARAFASPAGEAAILFKNTRAITNISNYALYALFVLGIVLISLSDGTYGMGEAWVSASFVVWFFVLGAAHGLVKPTMVKMQERAEALESSAVVKNDSEFGNLAKKLAMGEGAVQVLLVVGLVLMLWKPGA